MAAGYHLLTGQQTMKYEPESELGETVPLILRPLTPDEWERNQAMADKVLAYVLGDEQDKKPER